MTDTAEETGAPDGFRTRARHGRWAGGRWVVLPMVVAALVSVPVLVVAGHVLVPTGEIWRHLAATVLGDYVTNTLWLLVGVGIGTLVIGTGTAWLCSLCIFPGRGLLEWALLLPLAVPTYAIGFTYAGIFDFAGPVQTALRTGFGWGKADYWFPDIQSLGGVIVVMSLVLYPYVYLLGRVAFLSQSAGALEVGRTLGHGPWRGFWRIALPLARPALAGGVALALMEAIADFGTVQYYGVDTFTTGIYRTWFGLGDPAAAAQLSAVLLAFVLVLLLGEEGLRRDQRVHNINGRMRPLARYRLRGPKAGLALIACLLPVGLGFLLPGAVLLAWTVETATDMIDGHFITLAFNSFLLALVTAVLAVALSTLVAFALRLGGGRRAPWPARWAARVAGLGYAVPGSVIAVGVLLPFAALDNWIDTLARDWFGFSTGLLLTGGIAALVFGYLVRFLAVSLNAVNAAMARVAPSIDGAARTLGATPGRMLRRVHMPLISGGLLTAGLLVFVDVMKELPATLILRPFNFDTLAVRAYELATDERLADSSSAALAIVLVGLLPVILLSRAITRSRPGGLVKDL